jgi:hypothetical protein
MAWTSSKVGIRAEYFEDGIGEGCGIVETGEVGGAVLRGRAFVWLKFGIGGQVIELS